MGKKPCSHTVLENSKIAKMRIFQDDEDDEDDEVDWESIRNGRPVRSAVRRRWDTHLKGLCDGKKGYWLVVRCGDSEYLLSGDSFSPSALYESGARLIAVFAYDLYHLRDLREFSLPDDAISPFGDKDE